MNVFLRWLLPLAAAGAIIAVLAQGEDASAPDTDDAHQVEAAASHPALLGSAPAAETRPTATRESPAPPEPAPGAKRDIRVAGGGVDVVKPNSVLGDVVVAEGAKLWWPAGKVHVRGDLTTLTPIVADKTTFVFDGQDQTIRGWVRAKGLVFRGGFKRLEDGGRVATIPDGGTPLVAEMVIETDATLVIPEGTHASAGSAYGYQVAGALILDGGTFVARHANGDGKFGADSWLPGSSLTIHAGLFKGTGDHHFGGATVTLHGGALEIQDDIWHTGDVLTMYGGRIRNATHGGMFSLDGDVRVTGGRLEVFQGRGRTLRIHPSARVDCSGGTVVISGTSITREDQGILVRSHATFHDLDVRASTRINRDSDAAAEVLVLGSLSIKEGRRLDVRGFNVRAEYVPQEGQGTFLR